jgi:hypothetical protein
MGNPSNQRIIAIATVVIIGLLGAVGYLLYNKVNQDKLIKQQAEELISTEKLQAQLEKEYYQALADLEEMRGTNDELNALIETQKQELKSQKDRISVLLRDSRDLEVARTEISKLKATAEKYLAEITSLKEENVQLTAANVQLGEEKTALTEEVLARTLENEELTASQAVLTAEKASLEMEKSMLSKKVNIASVIKIQDIDVSGYRLRSSGKESETRRAGKIDGLKICFTALDNPIAGTGQERFHVRVINPIGETLTNGPGSGVLTNPNTGDQVRFTQYRDVEYENTESNYCLSWQPDLSFDPGQYTVEVYNKGFLAGMSTVNLK